MSSWTVVEFVDSETVEAVPSLWLHNDNQCYWPHFPRQKINCELKKCTSPSSNWPLYTVRVFKDGTFGNYLYV